MTRENPGPGEAFLYLYRLRQGAGPEYDRRHREVWPSMLALLGDAGISDYQIWRRGEIVVCRLRARGGYVATQALLKTSQVQREWSRSLADLFDSVADESGAPLWLDEVFRFGTQEDEGTEMKTQ
ncbi:MAG: L-rhamnose mutarotase [Dermatophilaceae bacterium]